MTSAAPGAGAFPRRPRGRPRGKATATTRERTVLGRQHYAFARACLQGISPASAWQRYLSTTGEETPQLSPARLLRQILEQLLADATAQGKGGHGEAAALSAYLGISVDSDRAGAVDEHSLDVEMSLDDLFEELGDEAEMYTEREMLELLRQRNTVRATTQALPALSFKASDERAARGALEAVVAAETRNLHVPRPSDELTSWLTPQLHQRLLRAGINTVSELTARISASPGTWHRRVGGVGTTRARALVGWLQGFGLLTLSTQSRGSATPRHDTRSTASGNPREARLIHEFLSRYAQSSQTRRSYLRVVKRCRAWALSRGLDGLSELSPALWSALRVDYEAGRLNASPSAEALDSPSPATLRHGLMVLRALGRHLQQNGLPWTPGSSLDVGPINSPQAPTSRVRAKRPDCLVSAAQARFDHQLAWHALLKEIDRCGRGPQALSGRTRLRAVVHLMRDAGLSVQGVTRLRSGDLWPFADAIGRTRWAVSTKALGTTRHSVLTETCLRWLFEHNPALEVRATAQISLPLVRTLDPQSSSPADLAVASEAVLSRTLSSILLSQSQAHSFAVLKRTSDLATLADSLCSLPSKRMLRAAARLYAPLHALSDEDLSRHCVCMILDEEASNRS